MATTHLNYARADHLAVKAALTAQMPNATMQTAVSTNWRGWRHIRDELDLDAVGPVTAPACGALWDLVLTGPLSVVLDQDAAAGRFYSLVVYLRHQIDPMPPYDPFVVDFDETLKAGIRTAFEAVNGRHAWSDVPPVEQARYETNMDMVSIVNLFFGD